MKKPSAVREETREIFKFSKDEVSSVPRALSLEVAYHKIKVSPDMEDLIEEVIIGAPIHKVNDPVVVPSCLELKFEASGRDCGSLKDLSKRKSFADYDTIKEQAIALVRAELPEYVTRLLPAE